MEAPLFIVGIWADHRLLTACAALSQRDVDAPRASFFRSLRAALNHILTVDLFHGDAMEVGTVGPAAWANPEPCRTIAALHQAQAAIDRCLIAVVEHRDSSGLDRLLLHLFQHQIHHRGQAHAMLAGTLLKPPQLDEFFSAGEAPLHEPKFADLGWAESMFWIPRRETEYGRPPALPVAHLWRGFECRSVMVNYVLSSECLKCCRVAIPGQFLIS